MNDARNAKLYLEALSSGRFAPDEVVIFHAHRGSRARDQGFFVGQPRHDEWALVAASIATAHASLTPDERGKFDALRAEGWLVIVKYTARNHVEFHVEERPKAE